jgi:PPM family protein phosphatase
MRFSAAFATDIGRKRQQNQDNGINVPDLGLFLVADGMGGHRGGETASAMVVEIVPQEVRNALQRGLPPKGAMTAAIRAASQAIFERAVRQSQLQGMGTTATALLFRDGSLTIGHVGDSRCYYFRPQALWQVTRDHSLVQEKLRAGLITRDQLKTDRMKNVITRSVGYEQDVVVDVYEMSVQPGDLFLVCSDGLSGLLDDLQMLKIVQREIFEGREPTQPGAGGATAGSTMRESQGSTIERVVRKLVDSANANGGDDNITASLIQVLGDSAEPLH